MTPKEKAEELFYKMLSTDKVDDYSFVGSKVAKQCALICVDEIMYNNLMEYPQHSIIYAPHKNEYWQQVKQEIEKL
jgi:hypothetical protein